MRSRIWRVAALMSLAGLPGGCGREDASNRPTASRPADGGPAEEVSAWEPIFVGVEMGRGSARNPRPLQVRAVRVDLREPTVDFLVTPSNGKEPMDCAARTTSEFLAEFKCQVAINGSLFGPAAGEKGSPLDVKGLSLSRGDLYSPPNQIEALLIGKDRKAWIARPPINAGKAYNGLSGFHVLLVDGVNQGKDEAFQPRSAVGVSRDGRYLVLMTIDGRQVGYSEGASTAETAEWIREFGAYNALNLDGGSSTAMVMQGADGKPVLLNRPSSFIERRVANHLGVFAKGLAGSYDGTSH